MTDKFPGFTLVRRGYARGEVDRFLLGEDGGPYGEPPEFTVVARGYDPGEVDAFLAAMHVRDGEEADAGETAAAPGSKGEAPPRRRWGLLRNRRS
ncbi:DivIVA domain-containing protein [Streptodolium elevatio]